MDKEIIDRLYGEKEQLGQRLSRLTQFMTTENYENISLQQKDMIYKQKLVMKRYFQILNDRIEDLKND